MTYRYTFIGEFGQKVLTYKQYLKNKTMRGYMNDPDRLVVLLGTTILTYNRDWLDQHEEEATNVAVLQAMLKENPMRFFLPSCNGTKGALQFLCDTDSSVKILTAPNRVGKTTTCIVDLLLDLFPSSEDWEIHSKHGVTYRKWRKPLQAGVASSDWKTMQRVIWPEIKKWIPKWELGEYDDTKKGAKTINWRQDPTIKLACGSEIFFFCYEQKQGPFESQALDRWLWDEQGEEAKFDGGDERLRTRRGRHTFGLTPHAVEGRPDTGARSWIHDMLRGTNTKGHSVKNYKMSIADPPDWVYPEVSKEMAYEKWVAEPKKHKNHKAEKEGRARYYGEWHDAGGLFYDDWDDSIHLIAPFAIPDNWTRYRAIDHGLNVHPTYCLWGAVSPAGDLYLYREYYQVGKTISENCRAIIKASGNTFESLGKKSVERAGLTFERIRELNKKERYLATVLDSRSKKGVEASSMLDVGKLYRMNGLNCRPASGANEVDSAPAVREFMKVSLDAKHKYNKVEGCSRMFVFNNLANFIRQIHSYARDEHVSSKVAMKSQPKENPRKKFSDAMDALRYMCQIPPRYIAGRWAYYTQLERPGDEDWDKPKRKTFRFTDKITGY